MPKTPFDKYKTGKSVILAPGNKTVKNPPEYTYLSISKKDKTGANLRMESSFGSAE